MKKIALALNETVNHVFFDEPKISYHKFKNIKNPNYKSLNINQIWYE